MSTCYFMDFRHHPPLPLPPGPPPVFARWRKKNRFKRIIGASKYREIFEDVFEKLEQLSGEMVRII